MDRKTIDKFESARDTTARNMVCLEYFVRQRTLFEQDEQKMSTRAAATAAMLPFDELEDFDREAIIEIAQQKTFVAHHEWKGRCRWCKQPGSAGESLRWKSGTGFIHAEHADGIQLPKKKGKK